MPLVAGERLVADVREQRAFDPGRPADPGEIGNDRDPAETLQLAEQGERARQIF